MEKLTESNHVETFVAVGEQVAPIVATRALGETSRILYNALTRVRSELVKKNILTSSFKRNVVYCAGPEYNIFVLDLNIIRTLQVRSDETIGDAFRRYGLSIFSVWYSFGGKPLNLSLTFADYNIGAQGHIVLNNRVRGGSGEYRLYTHVYECERQLDDLYRDIRLKLQAEDVDIDEMSDSESEDETANMLAQVGRAVESMKGCVSDDKKWLAETLESFVQIVYWFRKCESTSDYIMHITMGYKLLTGKGVSTTLFQALRMSNLQAEEDKFTKVLRDSRDLFAAGTAVAKHPLLKKIKRSFTYLLIQGFLSKVGFEMEPEEYLKLEAKTKVDYNDHTSMFLNIVDTALCICERLDAYRLTGDWKSLIHDDDSYAKWLAESDRLIALAPFTANLGPHGTTYFTFLSDLDAAIEKGTAMCKYSKANTGAEGYSMRKKLNSLQMLKNVEITRKAALSERKAPLGVLIHGHSSVAKSTFSKMLFYYYGQLHGLECDDFYRYVRSPGQDHWDNFRTSMWAIQLDDIAFILPKATAEPDPTLMEALHLIGNIAFVPPQADLADKGKTPVMSELVTATTNAEDLNATEYFHCPLAVQRRFAYVVNVKPKAEHLQANGMFINTATLDRELTSYPDYWDITVQKFVPSEHNGRQTGALETVAEFSNSSEFLAHFGKFSMEHKRTQEQALGCDKQMREFKVCTLCYRPATECECVQAWVDYGVLRFIATYLYVWFWQFVGSFILHLLTYTVLIWLLRFGVFRYAMARIARFCDKGVEIKIFGFMNANRNMTFKVTVRDLIKCGGVITAIYATYTMATRYHNSLLARRTRTSKMVVDEWTKKASNLAKLKKAYKEAREQYKQDAIDSGDEDFAFSDDEDYASPTRLPNIVLSEDKPMPLRVQGNIHGTTEEQLQKEESRNVWYNPTLELHQFDVPKASQSLAVYEAPQIRDLFAQNCVKLVIEATDAKMRMRIGGVFLRGQFLCMNRHALRVGEHFRVTVIDASIIQGLSSNICVSIARADVKFIKELDIAVVRIPDVPPRKDILKYWNDSSIPVTRGAIVTRTKTGEVEYDEIFNVELKRDFPVETLGVSMPMYLGTGLQTTQDGDCGSLGVAITPRGPIILGIHTLGHEKTRGIPHVTRSQLEALCVDDYPTVVGGGEPSLTLQGANILLPPHHKSLFRYLPEGTANVYGSIPGGRPKGRSRVCATPLQEEMLEHFDIEVEYGKPCMSGWQPVYNNVKDMVKPNTDIDRKVLRECSKAFTEDIIKGLTEAHGDAWMGELVFLSDRAAVNGLPGVKFIDRINTSTSMGSPWNETKRKHLVPDVTEEYPEGVTFTEEVWDRVRKIEKCYVDGRRAYPVYTGHLKDEAKEFQKIIDQKTRLFVAAPADFSTVVRKTLLSFVRLVQKNKFVFEAAPGTTAQSKEWTDIYNYLTQHGMDQLVAGDYSKYDKSMIAQLVLEAFQIIINLHRRAGFSEEECRIIACIGMDIAFPVVNLNGDVVEFFGTNPSGHPLTVIINSLVNSLYVRYAYAKANPEKSVAGFKENVALMTYGDDNAMGVAKRIAEWFNHTAIQREMAKIGVGYTMADKGAESVPFIHINDCSFLKRKWRFEPDVDNFVCPLEEKSIQKSLTVWVPSRTIDRFKQMVEVIVSANNEYFFYGRERFEKERAYFQEVLKQSPYCEYVKESTLPDWEDLCERFRRASASL